MSRIDLKNLTHHAYALVGDARTHDELLIALEKDQGLVAQANPDFHDLTFNSFTIDDARKIRETHDTRPIDKSGKKIFVLKMNSITVEAQNALLKLLEEPADYAHFFLIIPSAHLLIPTVKSRLSFIKTEKASQAEGDDTAVKAAKAFIKSSGAQRLEIIKDLLDDITKEKKTKQDAISFLDSVESELYHAGIDKNLSSLQAISNMRTYMSDRAPSLKMLLEYVALNI
jgi:DNA polymerase III delta prime subunit